MAAIGQVQIQATWILDPITPPAVANQILVQPGLPAGSALNDGFYVYFGHLSPPAYPNEEAARQAVDQGIVQPVIPVARLYMSRERLEIVHQAIGEALIRQDPSSHEDAEL